MTCSAANLDQFPAPHMVSQALSVVCPDTKPWIILECLKNGSKPINEWMNKLVNIISSPWNYRKFVVNNAF